MCDNCNCQLAPPTRTAKQREEDMDTDYKWTAAILVGVIILTAVVMMALDKAGYI